MAFGPGIGLEKVPQGAWNMGSGRILLGFGTLPAL
jgi:hypothetical protein